MVQKIHALVALDKKTGDIKWKAIRDSKAKKNFSFCTPLVIKGEVKLKLSVLQVIMYLPMT